MIAVAALMIVIIALIIYVISRIIKLENNSKEGFRQVNDDLRNESNRRKSQYSNLSKIVSDITDQESKDEES